MAGGSGCRSHWCPPWGHQWDSLRRRHLRLDRTRFAHRSAALHWWSSSWKAAHHCEWRMLHSIHLPINKCYDCAWMLNDADIVCTYLAHLRSWDDTKTVESWKAMLKRVRTVLRFQLKKLGGLYLDYASIAYYATWPKKETGHRVVSQKPVAVSSCLSEQKGMKSKEWHWSSGRWGWRYSSCWSSPYLLGWRCFRQEVLGFCQLCCSQDFAVHASCFQSLL